uniref:Uncharacterized protein AlNc14C31G2895 n=2 Tax=Albugo laibachii Nc14 TaxID=890382 RepID=F0W7U4_9STRA|nr:conserved hypothetical protein [Albugo laibachii Nc14]|eukprot:CCA17196.1 conserved hypothetical protein [Albugo laibachii Nc14]
MLDYTRAEMLSTALSLMTASLHHKGVGLDILYSPIHLSRVPESQRAVLGSFWYSILQQWNRLLRSPHNTSAHTHDRLQAPLWRHYKMFFGPSKRPLEHISKHSGFLYQRGLRSLSDFITQHDSFPTAKLLQARFPRPHFQRNRCRTARTNLIVRRFEEQGLLDGLLFYEPFFRNILLHLSNPGISETRTTRHTNQDLYKLLHRLPKEAISPVKALEVRAPHDWTQVWKCERQLDRDLLPIYFSLKFRLQDKGLNLRRKYRFHISAINCIFACDAHFRSPYQWSTVVYWNALDLNADACKKFGLHNIITVLNVIRCVSRTETISLALSGSKSAACNIHSHLKRLGNIVTRNDRLQGLSSDWTTDPEVMRNSHRF